MELTLQIPDDIASHMAATGTDLSRRALESFALEEFRNGRIAKAELRRVLSYGTRWELDGFLKAHGVYEEYTLGDFEAEREAFRPSTVPVNSSQGVG